MSADLSAFRTASSHFVRLVASLNDCARFVAFPHLHPPSLFLLTLLISIPLPPLPPDDVRRDCLLCCLRLVNYNYIISRLCKYNTTSSLSSYPDARRRLFSSLSRPNILIDITSNVRLPFPLADELHARATRKE